MFFLVALGCVGTNILHQLFITDLETIAMLTMYSGGDIPDIITLVTIAREYNFDTTELQVTQPGRGSEYIHLPAGIVDIVFGLHIESDIAQYIGERSAISRAATMTDMQRPGGIG